MDHFEIGGSKLAIGSSFAAEIGEGSISGTISRCFDELKAHVDLAQKYRGDVLFTSVTSEGVRLPMGTTCFFLNRQSMVDVHQEVTVSSSSVRRQMD